jgi:hypothetical protein
MPRSSEPIGAWSLGGKKKKKKTSTISTKKRPQAFGSEWRGAPPTSTAAGRPRMCRVRRSDRPSQEHGRSAWSLHGALRSTVGDRERAPATHRRLSIVSCSPASRLRSEDSRFRLEPRASPIPLCAGQAVSNVMPGYAGHLPGQRYVFGELATGQLVHERLRSAGSRAATQQPMSRHVAGPHPASAGNPSFRQAPREPRTEERSYYEDRKNGAINYTPSSLEHRDTHASHLTSKATTNRVITG